MSDHVELEAAGRSIRLTHPDKVYFPGVGATKADLARFYLAVEEPFLRANGDRPTLMQRFPHGVGGPSFFQKRVPSGAPPWLRTTIVTTPNGTTSNALVMADIAHAVWAVNLGCLGFHFWPYRGADPDRVDELRIDLDPQPGVSFAEVRRAASCTRDLLDECGIDAGIKTTGSRGLHLYVPLEPRWASVEVRQAAVALARELERRHPELITAAWWKEERGSRVFVDYNQNAPHKTVFGPWSVRARTGGQVSTPFAWDELDVIAPNSLDLHVVPERLMAWGDPWERLRPQRLEPLLELARADRERGLPDAPWPPVYPKMPGEPSRVAPSRARRPKRGRRGLR